MWFHRLHDQDGFDTIPVGFVPKTANSEFLAQRTNGLPKQGWLTIQDRRRTAAHHIFPIKQNLKQKIKMKNVAKITVLLMALTASEASRLGNPSEVSDDSSFIGRRVDLASCRCCDVIAITITVDAVFLCLNRLRTRSSMFLPTPNTITNPSNTSYNLM
jgi:hypothetical protein